jgi:hypothetical protein
MTKVLLAAVSVLAISAVYASTHTAAPATEHKDAHKAAAAPATEHKADEHKKDEAKKDEPKKEEAKK